MHCAIGNMFEISFQRCCQHLQKWKKGRRGRVVYNFCKLRAQLPTTTTVWVGSSPMHPVPLLPSAKNLSLFISLPVCPWSRLLTGEEGGGAVGEEPNIRRRESLVFYISFNTLFIHYFNIAMQWQKTKAGGWTLDCTAAVDVEQCSSNTVEES